jgi:pSer/pThr/pTyr-binding forkhead associated (FHA) protein
MKSRNTRVSEEKYLKALTPTARQALGGEVYQLIRFPFRVGRRDRGVPGFKLLNNPVRLAGESHNDFLIKETGHRKFLSRDHFLIDLRDDRIFVLVDRGSTLGTLVEGRLIGGSKKGGEAVLHDGAVIIPGGEESPFVFRFGTARDDH